MANNGNHDENAVLAWNDLPGDEGLEFGDRGLALLALKERAEDQYEGWCNWHAYLTNPEADISYGLVTSIQYYFMRFDPKEARFVGKYGINFKSGAGAPAFATLRQALDNIAGAIEARARLRLHEYLERLGGSTDSIHGGDGYYSIHPDSVKSLDALRRKHAEGK